MASTRIMVSDSREKKFLLYEKLYHFFCVPEQVAQAERSMFYVVLGAFSRFSLIVLHAKPRTLQNSRKRTTYFSSNKG